MIDSAMGFIFASLFLLNASAHGIEKQIWRTHVNKRPNTIYSFEQKDESDESFWVHTSSFQDSIPLYLCKTNGLDPGKEFTSIKADCEGHVQVQLLGYLSPSYELNVHGAALMTCIYPKKASLRISETTQDCLENSNCSIITTYDLSECLYVHFNGGQFLGYVGVH